MMHILTGWGRSSSARLVALVGTTMCVLALTAACNAGGGGAVEKAQIAVRANPSLELVATDERQGVLTVKVKRSGQVLTVSAADIVAGTAFRDLDTAGDPSGAPAAAQAPGGGAGSPSNPQGVNITGAAGQLSVTRSGNNLAIAGTPNGAAPRGAPASQGNQRGVDVTGPGGQVSVRQSGNGGAAPQPAPAPRQAEPSGRQQVDAAGPAGQVSVTGTGNGVTVKTPDGRTVSVAGAGAGLDVLVDSQKRDAPPSNRRAPAPSNQGPDPSGRGANIDESRLERRTRPVSCVGGNSAELNDVLLNVNGVAVESLGACVIHIRNSHIVGDIAIKATGGTTITVENSIIEGRLAFRLEGGTNVSVQQSTVHGTVQKIGEAGLRDLGNNLWR